MLKLSCSSKTLEKKKKAGKNESYSWCQSLSGCSFLPVWVKGVGSGGVVGREWRPSSGRPSIGLVSKTILGKLLKHGVERMWVLSNAHIPPWTELLLLRSIFLVVLKIPIYFQTQSDDPVSCYEKPMETNGADQWNRVSFNSIGLRRWFSLATERIVGLSPKVDRRLHSNIKSDSSSFWWSLRFDIPALTSGCSAVAKFPVKNGN